MYLKLLIQLLFLCGYWGNEIRGEESSQDQTVLLNKLALENGAYFYDTFNEKTLNKWVISEAKKEGVDGEIALYDGDWTIDLPIKLQLKNDYGLVFKQKAKHRAIASLLRKDFIFDEKPFILQYEVLFQDGQECGGGYIKLISGNRNNIDLKKFHDKTPYSIMFGPDKCGTTNKIHFIFRHKNPLNGSYEEKHCIQPTKRFDEIFTDGKPHLFSLILQPDNSFKIFLDHEIINKGSLLTDFKPPVNPPSEIDDPNDVKPENWDERELIPDPDAVKPEDWDESEPHMIPDPTAVKPENWLDNEPPFIRDPSAEKPHDWDNDMDGEWEAPLVPNPACEEAAGCGEWTPPKINNPAYKGKWTPPLIKNPDYKGKWSPRKIPNKDYFVDQFPFKMDPIAAVGFELWSMSANILFDNILITDSEEFANQWAKETFTQKLNKIEESADTLMSKFIAYSNKYPWLWAMYTIVLLVLITLFVHCCFWSNKDDGYEHKKDDEPQPDDAEIPSTDEQNDSSNIETGISSSGDENVDKKESDSKDDENDDNNADDGKTEVLDDTGDISSKKTKTDDENDDIVEGIEG